MRTCWFWLSQFFFELVFSPAKESRLLLKRCECLCSVTMEKNSWYMLVMFHILKHFKRLRCTDTMYISYRMCAFLCGEGPRSRCYGSTAAFEAYCATLWRRLVLFCVFPCNGAPLEWNWQGKTEVLCPPQISHGLTRNRTRVSAVRSRRLTAWAIARPCMCT
jgi:hypothetical protein